MDKNTIVEHLITLIPVWLSLSVHEWAHAWSAWRLGDDTARQLGRMTINPLAHIDPVGTLLLPLLGVPFGWAKPVPVQPQRFFPGVSMRFGMMLVAVAGPLANLGLATLAFGGMALAMHQRLLPLAATAATLIFLARMVLVNVMLATFNAIPIPPLDGSRVIDALLPDFLRPMWNALYRIGPLGLMVVMILAAQTHTSLFQYPIDATLSLMHHVLGLPVR